MTPRVDIVDAINPKRVLGSIPRPRKELLAADYSMAACPRVSVACFDPNQPPEPGIELTHIRLVVSWVSDDNNWIKRAVFTTYNTLQELMMLREFLLPGETRDQAYYRRCW